MDTSSDIPTAPPAPTCDLCGQPGRERPTRDIRLQVDVAGQKPRSVFVAIGFQLSGAAAGQVPVLCDTHERQLVQAAAR